MEFNFTFASEDAPDFIVEMTFKDQTVLLPDWVLDAISYFEMEFDQQEEFALQARKVQYSAFLDRVRDEAVKLERQEQRDVLNRIQDSYVGAWFARRRMFKSVRRLRLPMR